VLCTAALYDFSGRFSHIITRQLMSDILFSLIHHLYHKLAGTQDPRIAPFPVAAVLR
jgi:hypothetical protein